MSEIVLQMRKGRHAAHWIAILPALMVTGLNLYIVLIAFPRFLDVYTASGASWPISWQTGAVLRWRGLFASASYLYLLIGLPVVWLNPTRTAWRIALWLAGIGLIEAGFLTYAILLPTFTGPMIPH